MNIALTSTELEIILDFLPPVYKESTPQVVKDLKMKLLTIKREA